MAKKFSELQKRMSPKAREASERELRRLIAEMPLRRLRAARELTQETLAKALNVNQSEVSKIENRADMYVSTLASYVKAMGGTLEIRAVFPEGDAVRISQFEELGAPSSQKKGRIGAELQAKNRPAKIRGTILSSS